VRDISQNCRPLLARLSRLRLPYEPEANELYLPLGGDKSTFGEPQDTEWAAEGETSSFGHMPHPKAVVAHESLLY
jgi:hypothetical protein